MSLIRWALSILAFPIGGWIAFQLVGSVNSPLTAVAAAAVAGAVIGAAQGLALGRRGGWRWAIATVVGMVAGSVLSALLTGAATIVVALAITGLVTGALVGAAQSATLRRGWRIVAAWTATVGLAWSAGWVISANVIAVNIDSGFVTFGLSGALLVTVVTAVVLRRILGPLAKRAAAATSAHSEVVVEAGR
ncbi:MAG TPA: hypothetical protein VGO31_14895 [Microbacteriaceae bacterium]|nr:hypothetical protein [Microbacteriaceae bacterium]